MAIYDQNGKAEVYDLINEANPSLSKPITPTNVVLGTPTVIANAVHPAPNTSILASPAPGNSDYIGKQTLRYRRRDLTKLFRGITVTVKKFASRKPTAANQLAFTVYELLPDINRLYGLNLTTDDLVDANILRGSTLEGDQYTTTVTVTLKTTSMAYVGSFALKWINTKQSIQDMITNVDLDGRLFPGGNLFDETHKEVISSQTFGLDATQMLQAQLAPGQTWPMQVINWNGYANFYRNTVLPWLNQQLAGNGTTITWQFDVTQQYPTLKGTIGSMSHALYSLPNAAVPEANSKAFNSLLVIQIPEDCPWASGKIYWHFNR